MRVALDVSTLNTSQISGVGVYITRLLGALRSVPEIEPVPVWRASRWKYRRWFAHHAGVSRPWLGGWGSKCQVLHGPDFRVMPTSGVKRVVTIHDLAFLRPGMTSPDFAAKKTADLDRLLDRQMPDAIIVISQATRRELLNYRSQLEDRVHQIYLGGDHLSVSGAQNPTIPENYFLFVGNLEARKNILGILSAFEIFADEEPGTRLKLVGKPGFDGERILASVRSSRHAGRIDLIGYCPNEQMPGLYQKAQALVYPSWIEGFGLPVIEAMHLGCPVITTGQTATGEIAGDAAWSVDPADPVSIARAMKNVISLTAAERVAAIARARTRAGEFTWARCARETAAVYRA